MAREGCGAGADRRFALLVAHPRRCRELVEAAGAQRAANETALTPDTCRKMQARQGALRSPSAIARSPIVLKQPAASKQGVAAGAPSLPARTGPCSHCSAPRRCHAGPALPGACSRHASGPWGRLEQASAAAADALWRRLAWALQLASGAAPTAPLPLLLPSAGLLAAAHAGSGKDIWGIDTLVNYPPGATAGGGRRAATALKCAPLSVLHALAATPELCWFPGLPTLYFRPGPQGGASAGQRRRHAGVCGAGDVAGCRTLPLHPPVPARGRLRARVSLIRRALAGLRPPSSVAHKLPLGSAPISAGAHRPAVPVLRRRPSRREQPGGGGALLLAAHLPEVRGVLHVSLGCLVLGRCTPRRCCWGACARPRQPLTRCGCAPTPHPASLPPTRPPIPQV